MYMKFRIFAQMKKGIFVSALVVDDTVVSKKLTFKIQSENIL
jgi:hypothetical protein